MRKGTAGAVLAAILLAWAPMAGAAEIGVVLTGSAHGFWTGMIKGMTRAARDLGVELVHRSPADGAALDEQKNIQLRLIDYMVGRGVAALVLAADPLEGVPVPVRVAVPTVLVDRTSTDFAAVSTICTDNFAAGRTAALSLAQVLPKGAKVAVLRLAPNVSSTTARENGFISVAHEKGWQVVLEPFVGQRFREAEEATAKALGGYAGPLDAVFAPNESISYGAVRVVGAMPAARRPRLVSFDWRPEFRDALAAGVLYATVLQDNDRMGYRAVAAAVAASRGSAPAAREFVDVTVVSRANLDDPAVRAMVANYED